MSEQRRNPHSLTLWESSKNEAGLVATGAVLGCALGLGGGYIVSQAAGTPLGLSLAAGGAAGAVAGGGVAAYSVHRMHESRADAALYADEAIADTMRVGRARSVRERRTDSIQAAVSGGMREALEGAQLQEAVSGGMREALGGIQLPTASSVADAVAEAISETIDSKLEDLIPAQMS